MKKFIALLLALSVMSGVSAFAAPAENTDKAADTTVTETASPSPEAEATAEDGLASCS